jgi:hypothetical protein
LIVPCVNRLAFTPHLIRFTLFAEAHEAGKSGAMGLNMLGNGSHKDSRAIPGVRALSATATCGADRKPDGVAVPRYLRMDF